jgi:predicted anti-sigma-YlaC factor YlaD
MMNCHKVLETLSDYLDDDVALATRRDLEIHLAECRTCKVIYDTAKRTLRIVTDVGSFEIPTEVSERLLEATLARIDAPSGDGADEEPPLDPAPDRRTS